MSGHRIDGRAYIDTYKHMVTGQNWKVPHKNCTESKALSITMDVEGYRFHCFKCGGWDFIRHENTSFRDRKRREAEKAAYLEEKDRQGFDLPTDFTTTIGNAGVAWLGKGGWTAEMIFKHGVGWSEKMSRVVIPVKPLGYIARRVYDDDMGPKYLSKTPRLSWWVSEPITDRCCLTEDILSAGKVGCQYPAMAMLGTDSYNLDIMTKCKQLLIWTDPDTGGEKARRQLHGIFDWIPGVQVLDIHSSKDPKYYTNAQIRARLLTGGAMNV